MQTRKDLPIAPGPALVPVIPEGDEPRLGWTTAESRDFFGLSYQETAPVKFH